MQQVGEESLMDSTSTKYVMSSFFSDMRLVAESGPEVRYMSSFFEY